MIGPVEMRDPRLPLDVHFASIRDLFINTKINIFNGNFGLQSGHSISSC